MWSSSLQEERHTFSLINAPMEDQKGLIPSSVCTLYFPSPSYTQDGVTPLYCASQWGYDGIVEQLILAGAIVDLQTKVGIATALNDNSPSASHVPRACWYLAGWVWNCI